MGVYVGIVVGVNLKKCFEKSVGPHNLGSFRGRLSKYSVKGLATPHLSKLQ